MKTLKDYLSPIVGGPWGGYTFLQHVARFQSGGLLVLIMTFMGIVIGEQESFSHEPHWFWIVLGFLAFILVIATWKGVFQHWTDLKNHTSR